METKIMAELQKFFKCVKVLLNTPGFRGVITLRIHVDTDLQSVKLQEEYSP